MIKFLMLEYMVPIRPDVNAGLWLPRDLTQKEANRLKALIDSVVMPTEKAESED